MSQLKMSENDFEAAKAKLNDPQSCFKLMRCKKHIALPPKYIGRIKTGIEDQLNLDLNCYSDRLLAAMIAYDNIRLMQSFATVHGDASYLHFNVEVDLVLFQPQIGSIVFGVVNKMSQTHFGCIVHGAFNASVPIPDDWASDEVGIGDKFQFEITHIFPHLRTFSMRGKVTDDPRIEYASEFVEPREWLDEEIKDQQIEDQEIGDELIEDQQIEERIEEHSIEEIRKKKRKKKNDIKCENSNFEIDNYTVSKRKNEGVDGKVKKKKKRKSIKEEPGEMTESVGDCIDVHINSSDCVHAKGINNNNDRVDVDLDELKVNLDDSGVMDDVNKGIPDEERALKVKKKKRKRKKHESCESNKEKCLLDVNVAEHETNALSEDSKIERNSRATLNDFLINSDDSLMSDYGSIGKVLDDSKDALKVSQVSSDSVFPDVEMLESDASKIGRSVSGTSTRGSEEFYTNDSVRSHVRKRSEKPGNVNAEIVVREAAFDCNEVISLDSKSSLVDSQPITSQLSDRPIATDTVVEIMSSFESHLNDLSSLTQKISFNTGKRKRSHGTDGRTNINACSVDGQRGCADIKTVKLHKKHRKHKQD